jgi:hypothetical protein
MQGVQIRRKLSCGIALPCMGYMQFTTLPLPPLPPLQPGWAQRHPPSARPPHQALMASSSHSAACGLQP